MDLDPRDPDPLGLYRLLDSAPKADHLRFAAVATGFMEALRVDPRVASPLRAVRDDTFSRWRRIPP